MMDYSEPRLAYAFYRAFDTKETTESEHLPLGISRVEYFRPRNWKERLSRLRKKAIVTIDDIPNKEHYQRAAEDLKLEDATEAMLEGLLQEGQVRLNFGRNSPTFRSWYGLMISNNPVASVIYDPQMGNSHEVTVYGRHNVDIVAKLLINYLNLQQG